MDISPPLPGIAENISLRNFNTFQLEANAQYYAEATSLDDLWDLLATPFAQSQPKFILGGGSNMLLVGDLQGLVIHNRIRRFEVLSENAESILLAVGGGEVWHDVVMRCIEQGWGGIENLSLIPGSVGAAPIQNIGAYGVELKDVFERLTAIDLTTGRIQVFHHPDCQFGYRDSVFKREHKGRFIIVEVVFRLQKSPHTLHLEYGAIRDELSQAGITQPTIGDVSQAVMAIRRSKLPDPAQIGNAGSFFKNPEIPKAQFDALKALHPSLPGYVVDDTTMKLPAGWLIEQAGWKGKRLGNYGVHAAQALVLVNHGGAHGRDILALSQAIMDDIQAKFGIHLEREVNIVGG